MPELSSFAYSNVFRHHLMTPKNNCSGSPGIYKKTTTNSSPEAVALFQNNTPQAHLLPPALEIFSRESSVQEFQSRSCAEGKVYPK